MNRLDPLFGSHLGTTDGIILNVSDDEMARDVVSRTLREEGLRVHEARSGRGALALATELHPALIVLSLQLPDIDGHDVCRRIKADPRLAEVPILQTSATFVSAERRALGLESPADAYLTQPVEPVELVATVRALLRASAAERRLRAAAEEWQQTFDSMVEGVAVAEPDGVVYRANDAMRQLVPGKRLVGTPLADVLDDIAGEGAAALVAVVRASGVRAGRAFRCDARWFDVSIHPMSVDARGAAGRLLAVVSDVTAQRALVDQERQRAQDLTDANHRKDQFLAMLAHELRNPLNAIATANALSTRLDASDERQKRVRETIARQTAHLARLVEDLLEVSRLTRGRLQLQMRDVDLVETLRQAVEASRAQIDARRHPLHLILPDEPLHLQGDPLRLEQAFVNVLDNAAKYSEPGTDIVVACERAEDGTATVRIRDEGIGIPPEHLEAVFDLFVQVDASLARTFGGVGVGLTLARGLIEQHGGRIHAESAGSGRGTDIVVTLPLTSAPAAGASTPEVPGPTRAGTSSLSVLIVDDNADSAEMLQTLLETRGHSVHVAHDGLTGLQAALSIRPDVALVDIGLPGLDGYEIAAGIRASGSARDTYLVAVTGYGRPEDRARAIEAGFDDHLVKPVELGDLLQRFDAVTERLAAEDDGARPGDGQPPPTSSRDAT